MADSRKPLRHHLPSGPFVAIATIVVVLLIAVFIYSGIYNIGADAPHSRPVYTMLEGLRDRSIAAHARGITVPADLESPAHVSAGAGLYGEMCQGCHLAPGAERTEISRGLYPQAPELAKGTDLTPAQQFWVIKHGVKLTAMPAWGKTHPDALIWDMVAFLQKMPGMTPAAYKAAVATAPEDHDAMMKVAHGHTGEGHV
ncbi:cytochrome c [Sphingomonas sp. H39-1-10]|uniref:c-type cytochrome n=1 Tax=Sphingomonas pollutisoli TaxID=3030829 RepID=UPI0023B8B68B|nr:cytochrome c [Sphingomonas pollutisoli]MDF0491357.1 cytochrome c [Sphingomonas pollutisoli]